MLHNVFTISRTPQTYLLPLEQLNHSAILKDGFLNLPVPAGLGGMKFFFCLAAAVVEVLGPAAVEELGPAEDALVVAALGALLDAAGADGALFAAGVALVGALGAGGADGALLAVVVALVGALELQHRQII